MIAQDVITGVRGHLSEGSVSKWSDDALCSKIGNGLLEIFRKRPDACIVDGTLPVSSPSAPQTVSSDVSLKEDFKLALVFHVAWQCWMEKGSDKQVRATADHYRSLFLGEFS